MTASSALRWLIGACAGVLLYAPAAHAQVSQTAQSAMPAPGMARIWFYREMAPYSTQATPYIRLNGAIAGISRPGGSFYRDVPPGHYHITVDSYGVDFGQARDVDLPPGAQVFARVVSNDNWIEGGGGGGRGGGGGGGYHRDTFYVWLYPFEYAWPVIAQTWFYGGGA